VVTCHLAGFAPATKGRRVPLEEKITKLKDITSFFSGVEIQESLSLCTTSEKEDAKYLIIHIVLFHKRRNSDNLTFGMEILF
jgi:hypothetical protein